MCESLDYIENKGKEIGKEIGKREGADLGRVEMLKLLIRKAHYTPEEAIEFAEIPMEDRERYRIMLEEGTKDQTA